VKGGKMSQDNELQNVIFGVEKDPDDNRDYTVSAYLKNEHIEFTTEKSIDWTSLMTPVKNQGRLGSCVAFSVCAVKEAQEKKEHVLETGSKKEYDLSEQWLYYKCKDIDCWPKSQGTSFRYAMKIISTQGIPVEQGWAYNPSKKGHPEKWANDVAKWYKCGTYWRIKSLEDIKTLLVTKGPQVIGILCFTEIFSPDENGIVPMPRKRKNVRGGHAVCLSGNTEIPLLNSQSKTIKELSQIKDPFWVYSCDKDKNIVPGLAHSARLTGYKKVLKVTLDNGKIFKCTKDHLIMKRDGSYVEAQFLKENDSLMPLYKKLSDNNDYIKGYEKLLNPLDNKWDYTHKIVANNSFLPVLNKKGEEIIFSTNSDFKGIIHHKDFNKLNNSPENLSLMTGQDHFKYHAQFSSTKEGRKMCSDRLKKQWENPEFRALMTERNRKNGVKVSAQLKKEGRCGFQANRDLVVEIGKKTGPINIKRCNTSEVRLRRDNAWNNNFKHNKEFKEKVRKIAINNIQTYNELLKKGEISLTNNQINARKNNAKNIFKKLTNYQKALLILKTTYSHFYKDKYECFENFVSKNIDNYKIEEDIKKEILHSFIPSNHKVVSVEIDGFEEVYDLTVEKYHNFAINSGVFVHNCVVGYSDEKQLIKFKNSWGTNWGQNGYGYISYDYYTRYCLDAWYFSDSSIQVIPKSFIDPKPPESKEVKMKVKLINKQKQLQIAHINKNGKDSTIHMVSSGMVTIKPEEISDDIRMRIKKGLIVKL